MFELNDVTKKKEAPDLVLAYTADQSRCEVGSPEAVGELRFWLRRLTGKDDREVFNRTIKRTRKGSARFAGAGETVALRFRRSVVAMEGHPEPITLGGVPVTAVTDEVYDNLPQWVISAVRVRLQELNADPEDEEDEGDEDGLAGE